MVKKYYEPYEQMYRKVDLTTGEVLDQQEEPAKEPEAQQDTVVLTPAKVTPPPDDPDETAMLEEDWEDAPDDPKDSETEGAQETISEKDAASYIVQTPLSKFNLKGIFDNFELDDIIIIGLIIILLLEDGGEDNQLDFPLIIVLGVLLFSDFFNF